MSNLHSSNQTPFVDGSLATVWHECSRSFYRAWLIRPLSKQEVANEIPMDEEAPPPFGPHIHVLKGTARKNGDGFKDPTKKGNVVFVWNQQLPSPYQEGQYPRVDNSIMSASTDMYDFEPATAEEARTVVQRSEEKATSQDLNALLDRFVQVLNPILQFRHVVSYNDTYFGEPTGLLKRTLVALERLSSADSAIPTSRLLRNIQTKAEPTPPSPEEAKANDRPNQMIKTPEEWEARTHTFRAGSTSRGHFPTLKDPIPQDPSPQSFNLRNPPLRDSESSTIWDGPPLSIKLFPKMTGTTGFLTHALPQDQPASWNFPGLKCPLQEDLASQNLQSILDQFLSRLHVMPPILREGPFSTFNDPMTWTQWAPTQRVDYGLSKTFVQIRFRAGGSAIGQAREFDWNHHTDSGANGGDIVAFRNRDAPVGYAPPGYPD